MPEVQNGQTFMGEVPTIVNGQYIPEPETKGIEPQWYIVKVTNANGETAEQERVVLPLVGDKNSAPDHKVTDAIRAKYRLSYDRWKNGGGPTSGIPVETLFPSAEDPMVYKLKFNHVFTVQQLAGLHDGAVQALGLGARELQGRAKEYLSSQAGSIAERLAKENAELKGRVEEQAVKLSQQDQTLAAILARLDSLGGVAALDDAPPKNKGGRPRKHPLPDDQQDAA